MTQGGARLSDNRVKRVCTTEDIFYLVGEKVTIQEDVALRTKMRDKPFKKRVSITF